MDGSMPGLFLVESGEAAEEPRHRPQPSSVNDEPELPGAAKHRRRLNEVPRWLPQLRCFIKQAWNLGSAVALLPLCLMRHSQRQQGVNG